MCTHVLLHPKTGEEYARLKADTQTTSASNVYLQTQWCRLLEHAM